MYYEGVFKPSKTDNYNPAAINFVGKKIAVQDGWIIKDGPLKGQHCFYLPNSTEKFFLESFQIEHNNFHKDDMIDQNLNQSRELIFLHGFLIFYHNAYKF